MLRVEKYRDLEILFYEYVINLRISFVEVFNSNVSIRLLPQNLNFGQYVVHVGSYFSVSETEH